MLRTSERKLFRECHQAWWWRYMEWLSPKGRPAPHFWFGTAVHYALAEWYKPGFRRGPRPVTTFKKWMASQESELIPAGYNDQGQAQFADALELGVSMLTRYVARYGKDDELETLAIEQPFQVDILNGKGEYVVTAVGTFDGALLDHSDDGIYLWEHKTAANIATAFLALDDQAGTYFAVATQVLRALELIEPGDAIDGVLYNYLRKAKPDERPKDPQGFYLNKNGERSKVQPPAEFHREVVERTPGEVNRQLSRIRDDALLMRAVREGKVPLTKNTSYRCPKCPYFDLCVLDEKGDQRAVKAYKRSSFNAVDPYADHRKSASELCGSNGIRTCRKPRTRRRIGRQRLTSTNYTQSIASAGSMRRLRRLPPSCYSAVRRARMSRRHSSRVNGRWSRSRASTPNQRRAHTA
jgi:hypothetical protein